MRKNKKKSLPQTAICDGHAKISDFIMLIFLQSCQYFSYSEKIFSARANDIQAGGAA